jgi:hypothetical protein
MPLRYSTAGLKVNLNKSTLTKAMGLLGSILEDEGLRVDDPGPDLP